MKKSILFVMAFVFVAQAAWADCVYPGDGKSYPTGTVIGGRACQANGTWK